MLNNIQHILKILKFTNINYYHSLIIILLGVIVETISIGIFIPVITVLISIEGLSELKFLKILIYLIHYHNKKSFFMQFYL